MPRLELTTIKFWEKAAQQELKEIRKFRNRQAFQAVKFFFLFTAVFLGTVVALVTTPTWMPIAVSWWERLGNFS